MVRIETIAVCIGDHAYGSFRLDLPHVVIWHFDISSTKLDDEPGSRSVYIRRHIFCLASEATGAADAHRRKHIKSSHIALLWYSEHYSLAVLVRTPVRHLDR